MTDKARLVKRYYEFLESRDVRYCKGNSFFQTFCWTIVLVGIFASDLIIFCLAFLELFPTFLCDGVECTAEEICLGETSP